MAVVKADAYGHGLEKAASATIEGGAACLGVATVDEGLRLRAAGITIPVLVLGIALPEAAPDVVAADLSQTVSSQESLRELETAAKASGKTVAVHLKIETGMGRIGVYPDEVSELITYVDDSETLLFEGLATHVGWGHSQTDLITEQVAQFNQILADLEGTTPPPRWRHAANSLVTLISPTAHLDMVRVGLLTYGISPAPSLDHELVSHLTPALSVHARITHIRTLRPGQPVSYGGTSRVETLTEAAIVPVGYGDGYPRFPSSDGFVLIDGKPSPILGSVCMDQLVIDVSDRKVSVGDEVVLLGTSGSTRITAPDLATAAGRIPYEMVTSLGATRLPFTYVT